MSNLQHAFPEAETVEAGLHFVRLRHVLGLVEQIAGRAETADLVALDENARIAGAYEAAAPVTQRRFDTLVAEVSGWASAGMDALALADDPANPPRAAAAVLVDQLDRSLAGMAKLLRL